MMATLLADTFKEVHADSVTPKRSRMSQLHRTTSDEQKRPESTRGLFDIPTPYPRHVDEFQQLYEQRHGVRLPSDKALQHLVSLLVIVAYRKESESLRETAI